MYIVFLLSAYCLASIEEWLAHKYLMHTNTGFFTNLYKNHQNHHLNTNSDYTMKNGDHQDICHDVSTIDGIWQMVAIIALNTGIFYAIFYKSIPFYAIFSTNAALILLHVFIWNTFHSYIHGFDASKICFGIPRKYIDNNNNVYVKWMIDNHRAHHDNCKGNFNIAFPFADYLFDSKKSENK